MLVTRCEIDDNLRSELAVAKKEGRVARYNTGAMFDEVVHVEMDQDLFLT